MKPFTLLAILLLAGCMSHPARLMSSDGGGQPDTAYAAQRALWRALDSLEQEGCKPPACYPDPRPPSAPK